MGNEGISVADALALRNSGSNEGNYDGFGGSNGAWWVIILILFFAVGGWGRGGYGEGRGSYRGDERMSQHLDRIMEGADAYQYGRDRYRDSGSQERMKEGLEKLMYAVCVFVESMADFAETPEEKEIIRKHIQKIKSM